MENTINVSKLGFVEMTNEEMLSLNGGVDWNFVGQTITTASTGAIGAYVGGKWGATVGSVGGPAGAVIGGIVGAAAGAIIYSIWD